MTTCTCRFQRLGSRLARFFCFLPSQDATFFGFLLLLSHSQLQGLERIDRHGTTLHRSRIGLPRRRCFVTGHRARWCGLHPWPAPEGPVVGGGLGGLGDVAADGLRRGQSLGALAGVAASPPATLQGPGSFMVHQIHGRQQGLLGILGPGLMLCCHED